MRTATNRLDAPARRLGGQALAVVLLVVAGFLGEAWAQAGKRVALVIGNGGYRSENWTKLPNATNDASDIAAALGRLGFVVTQLENAGRAATVRSLDAFSRAAAGAELALVFYAGHSIEVDKRNFLVPVDASAERPGNVAKEAVPLDLVLRAAERAEGLRLVLLDACRDNPFANKINPVGDSHSVGVGLGSPVDHPGEILVAYSAKAGTEASDGVGRNSPYTAALLYYLEQPGLEVGLLLRFVRDAVVAASYGDQEPSVYDSRSSRQVYFKPPLAMTSPSPTLTGPALVEKHLALTERQRQRIQVALWAQGFNPGLPTGRFDGRTREKIAQWQTYYGRKASGFLDGESAFGSLLADVSDPSGPVWLKARNRPCELWIARPEAGVMSATWSGACTEGRASGRGRLVASFSLGELSMEGAMEGGLFQGDVTYKGLSGPAKAHQYVGQVRDSLFHGRGIYTEVNGVRYEGEFRDGKFHGRGIYTEVNGVRYEGEFKNGRQDGRGTINLADGNRYEGEFRDGKYHGRGSYIWADGNRYDGDWFGGMRHGRGIYMWASGYASGDRYEGEYRDDKKQGKGTYIWANGNRYEGEWLDNERNGHAIHTWADGGRYEGEYIRGKRHGRGLRTWADGTRYEGEFRDGKRQGQGTFIWPDGDVYEGEFRDGKRQGQGTFIWPDGDVYEGEWLNSKQDGRGIHIWANGDRYEGAWRKSEPHGFGTHVTHKGQVSKGNWHEGCLTTPDGRRIPLFKTARACGFE